MKKLLVIGLTIFTLLTLAACSGYSYTDEIQNYAVAQNGILADSENTTLVQADVDAVMENLAGAWNLSSAGILINVQIDGTWDTSWGDIGFRGEVELTQDSGGYITEFIILEQSGPGAMYDSYGNIREEAFNVETNEFYWIPFPDEHSLWLFGTYSVDYDRLVIESIWEDDFDLGQEMERIR